jgi:hypothetical protein
MNHGLTNSTQVYLVKGSRFVFSGCEILAELLGIFGTMEGVNVYERASNICLQRNVCNTFNLKV